MTKSAYELRMEMLQLANDYYKTAYERQVEFARASFNQALEAGKASIEEWAKYAPAVYDFKDVINKAEDLYSFVNKKDRS